MKNFNGKALARLWIHSTCTVIMLLVGAHFLDKGYYWFAVIAAVLTPCNLWSAVDAMIDFRKEENKK